MANTPNRSRRRSAGFSLVEILIALGIFLIGMTAIVSLFPAAAILQRETTQEVISEMAAQSAASVIEAQKLTYAPPSSGNLGSYHASAGTNRSDVVSIHGLYPYTDRSFPTAAVNGLNISDCDLHWIPFIQDLNGDPNNPNWVARLFILESDSRVTYSGGLNSTDPNTFPRLASVTVSASGSEFTTTAANDIAAGDIVMDNNGNSHVVVDVNGSTIEVLNGIPLVPTSPTTLWYAPKFTGSSSPAQRVVTVTVNVVSP